MFVYSFFVLYCICQCIAKVPVYGLTGQNMLLGGNGRQCGARGLMNKPVIPLRILQNFGMNNFANVFL